MAAAGTKHVSRDPGPPTTIVLFGATGDLSRRKLLPGLFHLVDVGPLPHVRIVGTSLDDHTQESFVELVHQTLISAEPDMTDEAWESFARRLKWAPGGTPSR